MPLDLPRLIPLPVNRGFTVYHWLYYFSKVPEAQVRQWSYPSRDWKKQNDNFVYKRYQIRIVSWYPSPAKSDLTEPLSIIKDEVTNHMLIPGSSKPLGDQMSGCPIAAGFPHSNNVIMKISFHSETPAVQQYMQHPLTIK